MSTEEKVVKRKYKVKHGHAAMTFRTAGGVKSFVRHEGGETIELTDEEAKKIGHQLDQIEGEEYPEVEEEKD